MAGYRGQKKVLKRTNAPSSYNLTKLGGVFAMKPFPGPHSKRTSICLSYVLRYNLKFAENNSEVSRILKKRNISVNGKIVTSEKYPIGLMDILKVCDQKYLVSFNSQGKFALLSLDKNFNNTRLLKVTKKYTEVGKVPVIQTHNGTNHRYAHPSIKVNDTVVFDMKKGKLTEILPFRLNQSVIAIGGNNCGRVGLLAHIDSKNGHTIVSVCDARKNTFLTKIENVMVIGDSSGAKCELHRDNGLRLTHIERRAKKFNNDVEMTA